MNTLVMLDLVPGSQQEDALKLLVQHQIRMYCPDEECLVASAVLGTDHLAFLEIAREVDERSRDCMETSASRQRGIEKCAYIAVRSFPIEIEGAESYEVAALFMVFRTSDHVLRRYTVPDYDDDTPAAVVVTLDQETQLAQEKFTTATATPHEDAVCDRLADAVILGFADYQQFCAGNHS